MSAEDYLPGELNEDEIFALGDRRWLATEAFSPRTLASVASAIQQSSVDDIYREQAQNDRARLERVSKMLTTSRAKVRCGMKFTQLRHTLKGATGDPVELADLTFITSDKHEVGKTAILEAFRFAMSGAASAGKGTTSLDLLRAAEETELFAELEGVLDGEAISVRSGYKVGKTKKPPKSVTRTVSVDGELGTVLEETPEALLPTVEFAGLISLGDQTARTQLINRFGNLQAITQPSGLNEQQKELWGLAKADAETRDIDTLERLDHMRKYFATLKKNKNAEVKHLQARIEQQQEVIDQELGSPEAREALEEELTKAKIWWQQTNARTALHSAETELVQATQAAEAFLETKTATQQQIEACQAQQATLQQQADALTRKLAESEAAAAGFEPLQALRKLADKSIELDVQSCAYCLATPCDHQAARQRVADHLESMRSQLESREQTRTELAQVESQVETLGQQVQGARQWLYTNETQITNYLSSSDAKVKALRSAFTEAVGEQPRDLAVIEAELVRVRQVEQRHAALADDRQSQTLAENISGDCKKLEKLAKEALVKAVKALQSDAEKAINTHLPAHLKCSIEVKDGKCGWRLSSNNGPRIAPKALSGYQRAALTYALARAWAEDGLPSFVLLDADEELKGLNDEAFVEFMINTVIPNAATQTLIVWDNPTAVDRCIQRYLETESDKPLLQASVITL